MCRCKHFCIFEIICELLQPFWKISQAVIRISTDIPRFILFNDDDVRYCTRFCVSATEYAAKCAYVQCARQDDARDEHVMTKRASPSLRSWAGVVEDKSCNVDGKTNCYQNWRTTREKQKERNCPFCTFIGQPWFLTSLVGTSVVFTELS